MSSYVDQHFSFCMQGAFVWQKAYGIEKQASFFIMQGFSTSALQREVSSRFETQSGRRDGDRRRVAVKEALDDLFGYTIVSSAACSVYKKVADEKPHK